MSTYIDEGGSNSLTVSKNGIGGFNLALGMRHQDAWLGMTLSAFQARELAKELLEATK